MIDVAAIGTGYFAGKTLDNILVASADSPVRSPEYGEQVSPFGTELQYPTKTSGPLVRSVPTTTINAPVADIPEESPVQPASMTNLLPDLGLFDAVQQFFVRGTVIILGFIFVAVGLRFFSNR